MNTEQIIKLAREAGEYADEHHEKHGGWLEAERFQFATLVEQAEREACILAVEDVDEPAWYGYECPNTFQDGLSSAAKAIRARNRIADTSKTMPGLALDSGEFVPAAKITDWSAA